MKHVRPMIGVTAGLTGDEVYLSLYRQFMEALTTLGSMPVLLPLTSDEKLLSCYVDELDGFMFTGGGDVDPLLCGQMQKPSCGRISPLRDRCEIPLARILAERSDKPVLGICRGFQIMNIVLGGDLYQDLPTEYQDRANLLAHQQNQPETYPSHLVTVEQGSLLHTIVQADRLMVNSLHHQAVHHLGRGFREAASAPDKVIEAAELDGHTFFLGVQWHPERMWRDDAASLSLFKAFIAACAVQN